MSRKRIVNLFILLALMILISVGSWIAGSRIVSPAEAAARTAPPTPSPILVPVEKRLLTSDIVTRGTSRYGLPQTISLVPSALKTTVEIVTTLPVRDTQVSEGSKLLTASGRPVLVLQGDVPSYRDLTPGISGEDVRQLEAGLKRLGFDPGPVDGNFDARTSTAVAKWYTAAGWEPFGPTTTQLMSIRTLEQDLAVAQNNKLAADDAVASAHLAVNAARESADSANLAADAEVATRTRFRDRVASDPNLTAEDRANADSALAVAQAAQLATKSAGEASVQTAVDALKAAERQAKLSADIVTRSAADLEQAQSRVGVQVPSDELVFIPALPVRVERVDATIGGQASGPILAVTNNQLVIDSALQLAEASLVQTGMKVQIDEPDLGIKTTGTVAVVADTPGTFGADGYHIHFETTVDEVTNSMAGVSLRMTIPVKSTGGEVLTVPTSAISLAADGTSRVQVNEQGKLEGVAVEPGLSANGFVEVKPISGTLEAGQLVLVGYEKAP